LAQQSADTARFNELTKDLDPKDIEDWEASHPEELKELTAMKERVLQAQGFTIESLHGTNGDEFTVFDLNRGGEKTAANSAAMGIFSTDNMNVAEIYASNMGVGGSMTLAFGNENSPLVKARNEALASPEGKRLSAEWEAAKQNVQDTSKAEFEKLKQDFRAKIQEGRDHGALKDIDDDMLERMVEVTAQGEFFRSNAANKNSAIVAAYQKETEAENALHEYVRPIIEAAIPNKRVLKLRVKLENPAVYDAQGQTPGNFPLSEKIAAAKREGRDGVIFKNIVDPNESATHYVVFSPEQLKSSDPLALDADGKLITPDQWGDTGNPSILYQKESSQQQAKGSVDFLANGDFLIRGLKNPDISTALHEIAHVTRNLLLDRNAERAAGITDEDIKVAEDWAGAKDGKWDVEAEEKFARGFERYMHDGVAPVPTLQSVFDKIGQWMKSIYVSLAGTPLDVEITPAMRKVFDKLVSRNAISEQFTPEPEPVPFPEKAAPVEAAPAVIANAAPAPMDEESPTGLQHAITDADRARFGLPPRFMQPATTDAEAWDSAIAAEDAWRAAGKDGTAGSQLLSNLLNDIPRALTKQEHALLLHEKLLRQQRVEQAYAQLNGLSKDASIETRSNAAAAASEAQRNFDTLITYADAAGSASGLSLQARKMLVQQDFSIAALSNRLLASKNTFATTPQKLTDAEVRDVVDASEKLKALQARYDSLVSEDQAKAQIIEKLTAEVERERGKIRNPKTKPLIRKIMENRVEEAKARLEAQGIKFLLQEAPANAIKDLSTVGAGWLVDKAYDLKEFTAKLVSTFGTWVADHAESIYNGARSQYDAAASSVSHKRSVTPEEVMDALNGDEQPTRQEIFALAKAHAVEGARGEEILDRTLASLQSVYPDLTREEVAKTFTDYGRVLYPSQDEISKEMARVRNLERIALKIADLKAGKPPLRTGFQRGEQDVEVRKLEKEFQALLKETGIQVVDPATQLQSSLGAAKRRMENEIEELQRAIDKRERRVTSSSTLPYDEEALALKSRLEAKRAEYNEVFGTGVTPEKRLATLLKSLDRQIAEEDKLLADGVLKRPKGEPVADTPEIAEKRRVLAEKRQLRRDLYEAQHPGETALQQAKNAATRAIERLQSILASGELAVKAKKEINPDDELQALWDAREALSDEVAEKRRALPLTPEKEMILANRALVASEKTLAALTEKLAKNDLSKPVAKSTPASRDARVRAVRERIKELNKELAARRRDALPKMSPDEARMKRFFASAEKRRAELERKIREKDYSHKTPPAPLDTPEVRKVNYEIAKLKSELNEAEGKAKLHAAPWWRIAGHYAMSVGLLSKVVKLGGDVGVIFRNVGGLTYQSLTHDLALIARMADPFTSMGAQARREFKDEGSRLKKTLGVGLTAFFNPEHEQAVYEAIQRRPMSIYDRMGGIHYSAPFDSAILQKEDIPRANLLNEIPWWVWPTVAAGKWALFGASPPLGLLAIGLGALTKPGLLALDRAQRTMTNQSRAMWFDSAIRSMTPDGTISKKDAAIIGRAVMIASGRGTIKAIEGGIPVMNMFLNATRFYISRMQAITQGANLLNPLAWAEAPKARKEVAKMYARSIAGRAVLYSLIAAMVGKNDDDDKKKKGIVMNPLSADFGKVRVSPNLMVDFMSGINSFATVSSRVLFRSKINSQGKMVKLTAEQRNNLGDEVIRFLKTKRNINLAFAWDTWSGSYYGGEKVTAKSAIEQATEMIILNDTKQIFQELGPVKGAIVWGLMFGGAGTSVKNPTRKP